MSDLTAGGAELRRLRQWTEARIGLGRVGASMPTGANLEFSADHAAARDAVHAELDTATLQEQLESAGFGVVTVQSRAKDRAEYLRRPDLGRRLSVASAERLRLQEEVMTQRLAVVVSDGLSAEAPMRYAAPLLIELRARLPAWQMGEVVIARQARVALGDEAGELLRAEAVLVLLGERPGLKAADSLGAYLTYAPRIGTSDALRNCVSNVRENGLAIPAAVTKLVYLLNGARALGQSGVVLKDNSEMPMLANDDAQLTSGEWKGLLDATAALLER